MSENKDNKLTLINEKTANDYLTHTVIWQEWKSVLIYATISRTNICLIKTECKIVKLMLREVIMSKEVAPRDTSRAVAYELWMKAPNPMVTFFKTLDVTSLVRFSRKRNMKFITLRWMEHMPEPFWNICRMRFAV